MSAMIAYSDAADAFEPVHDLVYRPAQGPARLACWLALPDRISEDRPPLVAVHGIRRNARQQAELFAARANALGRPVIAPHFSAEQWPRYQQLVRHGRADLALIGLMAQLRDEGIWRTPQMELFGFSGGAQFAHRFAMMHPEMVARLTVASAGWYTFPDDKPFPYGLAARPDRPNPWTAVASRKIERFLQIPMQVCVGADDNTRDRNLRQGESIDAQQGVNRVARAINWTRALQNAARQRGAEPRAAFIALSACGHDFRQSVLRGGLDRIVIPEDGDKKSTEGETSPCSASDCATCERLCVTFARRLKDMS